MKSYTDIKQSRKLAEILPHESADMCYIKYSTSDNPNWGFSEDFPPMILGDTPIDKMTVETLPCWSLATLINILPRSIEFKGDEYYLRFMKEYVEYANDEVSIIGRYLYTTSNNNLVDACVEMIIKLHENNKL